VTGETGAVERPARFMSVEEALGWCVQHRPGAEVTIKRYDGSQRVREWKVCSLRYQACVYCGGGMAAKRRTRKYCCGACRIAALRESRSKTDASTE
jgi:hypothetical protein